MKMLLKFLLAAACIILLAACDRSDPFVDDLSGTDLKKAPSNCPEIVVEPEDGHDTENLVAAFEEAKSLGPGTVVRLTEGTYTIGMITVYEFDGVFTGAGKGKTIIQNYPELPCEEQMEKDQLPGLLKFYGGNVLISDLTIHLQDGKTCLPGYWIDQLYGELTCVIVLADFSSNYVPDTRYIKGTVNNIEIIAGNDGGYGTWGSEGNLVMGIYCGPDVLFGWMSSPLSYGDFSVTRCYFKDNLVGPDIGGCDEKSTVRFNDNVIEGGIIQMYIGAATGSKVEVCNNRISKMQNNALQAIWIDAGYWSEAWNMGETLYTIEGNQIEATGEAVGLYLMDNFIPMSPDVAISQLYNIRGNMFKTSGNAVAIMGPKSKNAKIWNNQFVGTGPVGIWLDGDEASGTFSEANQLTGNNFLEANYADAAVYLGPFTRNNKVVGVSSDIVVDEGTGNNIIGTKAQKHGIPPLRPLFKEIKPPR